MVMVGKNGKSKLLLVLLMPAIVLAISLVNWLLRRSLDRDPQEQLLTQGELHELADTLGIILPPSTRSVRVLVEVTDRELSFFLKVAFDPTSSIARQHAGWLVPNSEVRSLGFEERPYLAPTWYDATPFQTADLRFIKDIVFRNTSTTVYGLLRLTDETATLYLQGLAQKDMFSPPLLVALQKYPAKQSAPVLGPVGLLAERLWVGDGLPAKAPPASTSSALTETITATYGDWSTVFDGIGRGFGLLGQIRSCLWQSGAKRVRDLQQGDCTLICVRGYFVLQQDDVVRLRRDLNWVEMPVSEFAPAKHPDAPHMPPPLLRSDELVRQLGNELPFATRGYAILAPETLVLYVDLEQTGGPRKGLEPMKGMQKPFP